MDMDMDMGTGTGRAMKQRKKVSKSWFVLILGASAAAQAQVTVVPRISLSETFTDNAGLADTDRKSEQITQVSPGIRIDVKGARVNSYFDYALTQSLYAQNTSSGRYQNSLTTFGTVEAVENKAFFDFSGSISQQSTSAFGTQSVNNSSVNANQTEVSTYRLSPYVRGELGSTANYEARYSRGITSTDSASAFNTTNSDATVRVAGGSAFRRLGWAADAGRQQSDFSGGRSTEVDRINLGLNYALTPQLNLSVTGGRESNNYLTLDKKSYSTNSVGATWTPSKLTKISASRGNRSFGDTHSFSLEHRTSRTVWRFFDSKDVSTTPSQSGVVSLGSIYDLLFQQFESIQPDPVARAQLVNSYLQANGLSANSVAIAGFLTSAVSLQRNQRLSFALLGARDTITFLASRVESSRLDALSLALDDLSTSSRVVQRGYSINYAHRLTPDYSLGVLLSQQNTQGDLALDDSTLRSISVNVTGRVGKKATATVGARHVISSGSSAPYVENAVTGNLNVQF
jgi:uncharacterized protein (PEP-CTERM system associated)